MTVMLRSIHFTSWICSHSFLTAVKDKQTGFTLTRAQLKTAHGTAGTEGLIHIPYIATVILGESQNQLQKIATFWPKQRNPCN